jgi:uncharacterized protein YegP (UPF0339 family)
MATATKRSRAKPHAARRPNGRSESAAITFRVFQDNGGDYCWTIVGRDGESLAHSRPYATHDDAALAARVVRDGAGSGRLELRASVARDDSGPDDGLDRL